MFALDVFAAYHSRVRHSKLLLLGDGELREAVERKIAALNLQDSVILQGAVPNPADYLSAMDIFFLPSRWEGFGVAVIEAQVNGLPCLVSDAFQEESRIGNDMHRLSTDENPLVWAEKMTHLKRTDEHEPLDNPYDIRKVIDEVVKFYFRVVSHTDTVERT